MNKKGLSVLPMFIYVFFVFFTILFLGIGVMVFDLIYTNIALDVEVGQVNLKNITDQTLGKLNTGLLTSADTIGIILILGMALLMIMNGAFFGERNTLWIPIDILVMVFVFILSVYLSQVYDILINSSTLLSVFIDDIPKSSTFVLNLPTFVATIGALIMIFTYAVGRKEEGVNDILQG